MNWHKGEATVTWPYQREKRHQIGTQLEALSRRRQGPAIGEVAMLVSVHYRASWDLVDSYRQGGILEVVSR